MSRRTLILILMLPAMLATPAVGQQIMSPPPPATRPSILNEVTVQQKLGQQLPLDLPFRNEQGEQIMLRSLFRGKPVMILPVYYECPMLCSLTLNQFTRSLNAMTETPGREFDVVTVSFNHRETPELAAAKKKNYMRAYGRSSAEGGWHFLTGPESSIATLMGAIGFDYKFDEKSQEYAHAAAMIVAGPDGKISRYFLGIDFPPTELQKAIKDAAAGQVAAKAPEIFLYCFEYDPNTGKYGLVINRALKVMGIATVLGIATMIVGLNRVIARRGRLAGTTKE